MLIDTPEMTITPSVTTIVPYLSAAKSQVEPSSDTGSAFLLLDVAGQPQ